VSACFCGLAFWMVHTLWLLPLGIAALIVVALVATVSGVNPDEQEGFKGGE